MTRAFRWANGTLEILEDGGLEAIAWAINSSGLVVGSVGDRAVAWRNGNLIELMPPTWSDGVARDVNDQNVVVGEARAQVEGGGFRNVAVRWVLPN